MIFTVSRVLDGWFAILLGGFISMNDSLKYIIIFLTEFIHI